MVRSLIRRVFGPAGKQAGGASNPAPEPPPKDSRERARSMVMGLQDGGELQLAIHQPLPHWFGDSGIDDDRLASPCPDPDDVVLQDWQWLDSVALTGVAHR